MRVLLINPWIYDFSAYDLWLRPLGLLYIASFLERQGHIVDFIDCVASYDQERAFGTHRIRAVEVAKPKVLSPVPRKYKRYGIPLEEFTTRLVGLKTPDVIAITSMMTYWYPGVEQVMEICEQVFPSVSLVLGGIYATLCTEHARAKFPQVQVVPGSGLDTFMRFLGEPVPSDLVSWQGAQGLFSLPPAYHLYPGTRSAAVITSIGCPLHCTYCASRILQPSFIQRPVDQVVREIEQLVTEQKISDIAFYDDALLWNREKHAKPLFRALGGLKLPVRLHTPNGMHIREIDDELAVLMRSAGVQTLRLAFESSRTDRQADSSHKTNNQDLASALDRLRSAGFAPSDLNAYVLMGLPEQSLEEVRETVDFVHSLGCRVSLSEYSPIPHTVEFDRAIRLKPLVATEPLWQNNTIFPLLQDRAQYGEYEHFKSWVKLQNERM